MCVCVCFAYENKIFSKYVQCMYIYIEIDRQICVRPKRAFLLWRHGECEKKEELCARLAEEQ